MARLNSLRTTCRPLANWIPLIEPLEERRMLTTIPVTTTDDVVNPSDGVTSLREAIIQANAGVGDYTIQLGVGTYTLTIQGSGEQAAATGDLDIGETGTYRYDRIEIVGQGQADTIIDASGLYVNATTGGDRIFDVVSAGLTLSLKDMTLANGSVPVSSGARQESGGAIRNSHGVLLIDSCLFENNVAASGGAIYVSNGDMSISGSEFTHNSVTGSGGAVYVDQGDSVVVDSSFVENSAPTGSGGAIGNVDGDLVVSNSSFVENDARNAGAVAHGGGRADITGSLFIEASEFDGNQAQHGGAIHTVEAMVISNSTFKNNSSTNPVSGGGAIYNSITADTEIYSSTFSANTAAGHGGAIFDTGDSLLMANVTISGNSAGGNGGGFFSIGSTLGVQILHSTITGNRADSNDTGFETGGGIFIWYPTTIITVTNSIVAGNWRRTSGAVADEITGTVDIGEYNLIGDSATAGGLTNGVNGNIVGVAVNTVLNTTLANNGGPTQTHALIANSPAIDAGDPSFHPEDVEPPLSRDQRGGTYSRVGNVRVDIGAYEVQTTTTIAGRHIFYNQSAHDLSNAAINSDDDNAIATDKSPYFIGAGLAVAANATSYVRGINGIMIDLNGPHGAITASDFIFKMGNNNSPELWTDAPAPTAISVRSGAGVGGSDRVVIVWSSANSVKNQWLSVTVAGNDETGGYNVNTGLLNSDVFFWGNKIGDSFVPVGTSTFETTSADSVQVFENAGTADVENHWDYNRDGVVGPGDSLLVFSNAGSIVRLNIAAPMVAMAMAAEECDLSAVSSGLSRSLPQTSANTDSRSEPIGRLKEELGSLAERITPVKTERAQDDAGLPGLVLASTSEFDSLLDEIKDEFLLSVA